MFRPLAHTLLLVTLFLLSPGGSAAPQPEDAYELGVQAYADSDYATAYIHLKNALQADPNMVPARLLLAKVHFNAGDPQGAAKESEEALLLGADINLVLPVYGAALVVLKRTDDLFELGKQSADFTPQSQFEWALLEGQGHLLRNEPEAAHAAFERAARMYPDDVRANNTLAALYLSEGMQAEAARHIDRSLELDANNVKTLELAADLALAQDLPDVAQQRLERAHALDPDDLRVLRGLARVQLTKGNQAEMGRYLELILAQSPDDPAAMLLQALVNIQQGDTDVGEAMLADISQKLSELDTAHQGSDSMLFIQAAADYVRGSDQNAIDLFNRYLSRNRADLAAIRMLTDLYLRNGEVRRAAELLSDSREFVINDPGLSVQLLRLYIETGNVLGARELLVELRERSNNDPYVTLLEAELNRAVGKSAAALTVLDGRDFGNPPPTMYSLLRGALLLDLARVDEAVAVAQQLQRDHPGMVRVQNFATIAYLRAERLDAAQAAVDAALAISPRDVDARFHQAVLLKRRGQLQEAAVLLNQVLEDRPSHTRSMLLMASILLAQGREDEAMEWSRKVYAYEPNSTLPDQFQLDFYRQTGEWDKALGAAQQLAKADPLNDAYLIQLAEIYMQLQDYEVAQRPLRQLFALWQEDPALLRRLAGMQMRANNPQEARMSLELAQKLAPDDPATELALVQLDIADQQFDAARKRLEKLRGQAGERADSAVMAGELALAEDNPEAAQQQFMRAFELDPGNTQAVIHLYELSLQGVGAQAFTDALETQLKQSSLPAGMVRLLADSYLLQGKPQAAQKYYEALLEHPEFAGDPAVLNNLATIYAESNLDKALATAQRAMDAPGEQSAQLLDTMGWILTRRGEAEKALPYLRKAYTINSRDPEIRYHLGATLLALGRDAEATSELRAALANSTTFTGRADAERLLATQAAGGG